jgi:hypothetical protein
VRGVGRRPADQASTPSIAFVVPYVGRWPPWFPAHLQSCKYNPSIRWIFFTDCEIPAVVPDNVEFVPGSLRDFEKLFEGKTGIPISVETPWKLCDYKPTYGLAFEDYLAGFDFWGHCDVDVIWGNIRKFFATDKNLARYDVISARRKRITSPCTLYRNTDEINRLFLSDHTFRQVVKERENIRYDEHGWARHVRKNMREGRLSVHWKKFMHPKVLVDSVEWYWENGAIFDCSDKWYWYLHLEKTKVFDYPDEVPGEVMYLDLWTWKKKSDLPCDFGYEDDPSRFHITHSGISIAGTEVEAPPAERPARQLG